MPKTAVAIFIPPSLAGVLLFSWLWFIPIILAMVSSIRPPNPNASRIIKMGRVKFLPRPSWFVRTIVGVSETRCVVKASSGGKHQRADEQSFNAHRNAESFKMSGGGRERCSRLSLRSCTWKEK